MKDSVGEEALCYVRKGENRKKIWKEYSANCSKAESPFSYFMAGAPGSGKTEIVKGYFVDAFENCVIADADEIRKLLPNYNGKNASRLQKAASKGVDILYDNALRYGYNILVDGTFALRYEKCRKNIARSVKEERGVVIFYVYTNPKVAWGYAKKREYTEGRKIKILTFIRAFFDARNNINKIKSEFGDKVYVVGMINNYRKGFSDFKLDITRVDEIKKIEYSFLSLLLRIIRANIQLQLERAIVWTKNKLGR